jgi:hypothetical protein
LYIQGSNHLLNPRIGWIELPEQFECFEPKVRNYSPAQMEHAFSALSFPREYGDQNSRILTAFSVFERQLYLNLALDPKCGPNSGFLHLNPGLQCRPNPGFGPNPGFRLDPGFHREE